MTDQRIAKWTRWIEGPIKKDVLTMHLQRHAWRTVADILAEHQPPDSYWWEFMVDTYITTQAVALRRQADLHPDVGTLGKLIEQIRDDAARLTEDFWVGLWNVEGDDRIEKLYARRQWRNEFGGSAGDSLDPEIPRRDLDALTVAAAATKSFVDQHIAHSDASAVSADVTLYVRDVHDAIDTIGTLFQRYYSLLTASSMIELVPVIQHDWLAAFRVPWIRPST